MSNVNSMTIIEADRRTALSFLKIKSAPPESVAELLDKYEKLLLPKLTPRYVYNEFKIAELSFLTGDDIRAHLRHCDNVIIFAVTIGLAVDELIRSVEALDMAGAVVLDALASAVAERLCDEVEQELKAKYESLTARFSPGYGDWPLSIQQELLTTIDAKKQIGLHATDDGIMLPRKSVTAVAGILRT